MRLVHLCCAGLLPALAACSFVPEHASVVAVTDTLKSWVPGLHGKASTGESAAAAEAKALLRTKQFDAALRELRLAAEHGDVQSQYLLGLVYANGLGTAVSLDEARHWLNAAAEKGYAQATSALAGLVIQPTRTADGDAELARELLIWAIRHDDGASLQGFMTVAGVEAVDGFGRPPLAYAVTSGSEIAVKRLLAAGASADHADRFGVTPLMLAAEGMDDPILAATLAATKDVNARDSVGNSALFYAARVGRKRHVEKLLAAGASVNGPNADGWTVLDVSAKGGHTEVAESLRDAGATGSSKVALVREETGVDPGHPGDFYATWPALAIAASRDDVKVVEGLLAAGARADEPAPHGDTPLIIAAKYHAAKVIAPLLKGGATPSLAADDGTTALGYAAAHGAIDVLDALLEKGVSPDTHGPTEDPPLVRAARVGDVIAAEHLIEAGADVNSTYPGHMTALMAAAAASQPERSGGNPEKRQWRDAGQPEIVAALMAAKPNLALRDRLGRNALWFAAAAGNQPILDLLLAGGSPVDSTPNQLSPLFAAVQGGHADAVEHLLHKGLPAEVKNGAGDTPLIAAAALGDVEVVKALVDGGAAVDAQNAVGNTALIVASREGHTEVCKVLLKAGADAGLHNQDRLDALDTARQRHLNEVVALLNRQ
jgi:ankyrin repeat protein